MKYVINERIIFNANNMKMISAGAYLWVKWPLGGKCMYFCDVM